MLVRDWMTTDPMTVTPSSQVGEARRLMHEYGIRHLPVVDDGDRLVGIVSDRDVRVDERALEHALARQTTISVADLAESVGNERSVEAIMSSTPQVVGPDEPVEAAARLMLSRRISALPVVEQDSSLVGVITTTDCLLASLSPHRDDVSAVSR